MFFEGGVLFFLRKESFFREDCFREKFFLREEIFLGGVFLGRSV